jgi:hypothetical protein
LVVMETFDFHRARWRVLRVFSRNPLVRMTDRLETIVVALALVVGLVAAPFACTLGNVVHDADIRTYTEQSRTRHVVTATVIEGAAPGAASDGGGSTVMARWSANGVEHIGTIASDRAVKDKETVKIWVDSSGNEVDPPTPPSRAVIDAVAVVIVAWMAGGTILAALTSAARSRLDRKRDDQWERELNSVQLHEGGRNA